MPPSESDKSKPSFNRSLWMIEEVEHTLRLVPDDAERYYSFALIRIMRGFFKEAVQILEKATEFNPEHEKALSLLGEIYFKLGRYEKAAEALESVVKLDPNNLTAITWLSLAYHCLGNKGKAITTQSILQTIAPDLIVSRPDR
jgi:tetratricopeptide (TPR) repeat protein